MKYFSILALVIGALFSIQAGAAQPHVFEGVTHRYEPYSPEWTYYHRPEIGFSRVIDLARMGSLTPSDQRFPAGVAFIGTAGLFDINLDFPFMASRATDSGALLLQVDKPGESCAYQLRYLGDDQRGDAFYKPEVLRGQNRFNCDNQEIVRLEYKSPNSYRLSMHNTASGAEQWAGILKLM
jgi:hypothetical protein